MGRLRSHSHVGWLASVGITLVAGCSGFDTTELGREAIDVDAPGSALAPSSRSIKATLELSDGDLMVVLSNDSAEHARVSLNVVVDTAEVHSSNVLDEVEIGAGARLQHRIHRELLEGFDVAGSPALRADLHYGFELANGMKGRKLTSIATHNGVVRDRDEAIALGYQLPDVVAEGGEDELLDKAVGDPFRICVSEQHTFAGVAGGFIDDGLAVNLAPDTVNPAMTHFMYTARRSTVTTTGYLNTSGCTAQLARQTSGSETWSIEIYSLAEFNGDMVYASNSATSIPSQIKNVTIAASGSSFPVSFTFPAGESAQLNTATYLAYNSLRRLAEIGVSPQGTQQLRISLSGDANTSFYCHTATGGICPTAKTLRVGANDAVERETVAHEFGHFIHRTYLPAAIPINNTYSQANADFFDTGSFGDTPSANCPAKRTSGATAHSFSSIEWQSIAHVEGLANFFQAVTYNRVTESDCTIVETAVRFNCEAEGRSFRQCREWPDGNLYFMVGNELDWAKMYWDFLTDGQQNIHNYLLEEAEVTSWPAMPPDDPGEGEHWIIIRNQMPSTMATAWNDAAAGNVQDGAVH
jgi:hypothetical protein